MKAHCCRNCSIVLSNYTILNQLRRHGHKTCCGDCETEKRTAGGVAAYTVV